MSTSAKSSVQVADWGSVDGKLVKKFTLKNQKNQEVDVISYGATITSVRTPDKFGNVADIVCGFDNLDGYLSKINPYFGATVGRVANRIGRATFKIDDQIFNVSKNMGANTLHGGFKGWNTKVWETSIENDTLIMALLSEDGEEGFPGAVIAIVTFRLTDNGELIIIMKATATKATPINLTNHSYFNLAGHGTNSAELYKHEVTINADHWTVTDDESIPTGEIRPVDNSIMDLRHSVVLGNVINKVPQGGYDFNFCLSNSSDSIEEKYAAKVFHPSGRTLEVFTNQPGVQFYTANYFPKIGEGIIGKQGQEYFKHGAFCLETQNYPDAINHVNFPNSILRPQGNYYHIVTYKFAVTS